MSCTAIAPAGQRIVTEQSRSGTGEVVQRIVWTDERHRRRAMSVRAAVSATGMTTGDNDEQALVVVGSESLGPLHGPRALWAVELSVCTSTGTVTRTSLDGFELDASRVMYGTYGCYLQHWGPLRGPGSRSKRRPVTTSMVRSRLVPSSAEWRRVHGVEWFEDAALMRPVWVPASGLEIDDDASRGTRVAVFGEVCVDNYTYVVYMTLASNGPPVVQVAATETVDDQMLWHPIGSAVPLPTDLAEAAGVSWKAPPSGAWSVVGVACGATRSLRLALWNSYAKVAAVLEAPTFDDQETGTCFHRVFPADCPLALLYPTAATTPLLVLVSGSSLRMVSMQTLDTVAARTVTDLSCKPANIVIEEAAELVTLRVLGESSDAFGQPVVLYRETFGNLDGSVVVSAILSLLRATHSLEVADEAAAAVFFAFRATGSPMRALSILAEGESAVDAAAKEATEECPNIVGEPVMDLFDLGNLCAAAPAAATAPTFTHTTPEIVWLCRAHRIIDVPAIAFGIHLLHEACKLQRPLWQHLRHLSELVERLATNLGWVHFARYHANGLGLNRDIPAVAEDKFDPQTLRGCFDVHPIFLQGSPPNIDSVLRAIVEGDPPQRSSTSPPPEHTNMEQAPWPRIIGRLHATHPLTVTANIISIYRLASEPPTSEVGIAASIVQAVIECRWPKRFVHEVLAIGVAYPIHVAMATCREHPSFEWSADMLSLIGRRDMVLAQARGQRAAGDDEGQVSDPLSAAAAAFNSDAAHGSSSGTLEDAESVLLPPKFAQHWNDTRAEVVQNMLDTSKPIALPTATDRSDTGQQALKQMTKRALAQPVGRGMLSYGTRPYRSRDVVPIPPLVVNGQTADGLLLTAEAAATAPQNLLWPLFHNAVAAGLRFMPSVQHVQSVPRQWILHQARTAATAVERAGLILAAGLTRQLRSLEVMDVYALLMTTVGSSAIREPVAVAVTLGLAVSYRGSCAPDVFDYLQLHVQSLVHSARDLDSTMTSQAAALVSIGLLYERSANAWVTEMLLTELGRVPTDEHCGRRECYKLAAGLAIGLTLCGLGRSHGLGNTGIDDRLWAMIEGGDQRLRRSHTDGRSDFEERGGAREPEAFLMNVFLAVNDDDSAANTCNNVLEGAKFDPAVTGPPATAALALMYLQTGDEMVARRLNVPDGAVPLRSVAPAAATLRTLSATLVRWPDAMPSRNWLHDCLPPAAHSLLSDAAEVDPECIPHPDRYGLLVIGHSIAGAALAMGLRFAGTLLQEAKTAIMDELRGFMRGEIGTTGVAVNLMQRKTNAFDSCLATCAVGLALVMAGTADTEALALCRQLYRRTSLSYGEHQAVNMAIGMLFLGGGRCTLSNDRHAIAALFCSVFPIYASAPGDNTGHLQALRHLYVVASVPRWVEAVDVDTGDTCSVEARLILAEDNTGVALDVTNGGSVGKSWTPMPHGRGSQAVPIVTPCLLPDLTAVDRIEVRSVHHYTLNVESFGTADEQVRITVLRRPPGLLSSGTGGSTGEPAMDSAWRDCLAELSDPGTDLPVANALLLNLRLLISSSQVGFAQLERSRTYGRSSMKQGVAAGNEVAGGVKREVVCAISQALTKRFGKLLRSKLPAVVREFEQQPTKTVLADLVAEGRVVGQVAQHYVEEDASAFTAKWLSQALVFHGLQDPSRVFAAVSSIRAKRSSPAEVASSTFGEAGISLQVLVPVLQAVAATL